MKRFWWILILLFSAASLGIAVTAAELVRASDGDGAKTADNGMGFFLFGRDAVGENADVVLLLRTDPAQKAVSVLQIPRDTYISVSGYEGKVNGLFGAFSPEETEQILSDALGVSVRGSFHLGLDAVKRAVDALGGVPIDIPSEIFYEDPAQGLVISLRPGVQRLNGEDFNGLLRYRASYKEGDLDRLDVQKRAMSALAKRITGGVSFKELMKIYEGIQGNLLTNLSKKDIIALSSSLFSARKDLSFSFVTLPGGACYVGGVSYYVPCRAASEEVLSRMFARERVFDPREVFLCKDLAVQNIYNDKNMSYTVYREEALLPQGSKK